jgi:hypothetical protein
LLLFGKQANNIKTVIIKTTALMHTSSQGRSGIEKIGRVEPLYKGQKTSMADIPVCIISVGYFLLTGLITFPTHHDKSQQRYENMNLLYQMKNQKKQEAHDQWV